MGSPISFVKIHVETKHDIRVESCKRGKRLLRSPATRSEWSRQVGSRVGLTKETDDDQEHGARRSGGGCVARIHGRYKFCESRYRDAKKSPEDVEDGEFELLGETGLDGEHELFEDENEECIFSP